MENNEMHDQFVDRRLAALDPSDNWQPDPVRGLARLRQRQKAHRTRTGWTWAAVAASVTGIGLLLLAPQPCSGAGCVKLPATPPPAVVALGPQAAPTLAAPVIVAQAAKPAPKPAATAAKVPTARNFKESGSVVAPITCELFTDYQCPHCATVFLQTMPGFVANY